MANKCVLDKKGKKTGKRKNQTTENFPNISNRQKCFEKRARRVERLKMKSGDDFVKKDIFFDCFNIIFEKQEFSTQDYINFLLVSPEFRNCVLSVSNLTVLVDVRIFFEDIRRNELTKQDNTIKINEQKNHLKNYSNYFIKSGAKFITSSGMESKIYKFKSQGFMLETIYTRKIIS